MLDSVLIDINFLHEKKLGTVVNSEWLRFESQKLLYEKSLPQQVKKSIYLKDMEGGVLYYQQPFNNENIIVHTYIFPRESYVIKFNILVGKEVKQMAVDDFAHRLISGVTFLFH
jgi:hypothetical protein